MDSSRKDNGRQTQFTLRTVLLVMLFIALGLCWYASLRRASLRMQDLRMQLAYYEAELEYGQGREQLRERAAEAQYQLPKGVLSRADLEGKNLRGVSVVAGNSAFQVTNFTNADLQDASLSGGLASFQGSRFDQANLVNAKLTGGGSAFQMSSFVKCDLTGATLTGGGASFQASTFKDAKLIGAVILCNGASFQLVNIDNAEFQGADLSVLDGDSLESCFFKNPPSYDGETRFPAGFDPVAQGWKRAPK